MEENYFTRKVRSDTHAQREWYESGRGAVVIGIIGLALVLALVYNIFWG